MTLIDFGNFKIRFDPKDIRINIDGELIDVGARRDEEELNDDDKHGMWLGSKTESGITKSFEKIDQYKTDEKLSKENTYNGYKDEKGNYYLYNYIAGRYDRIEILSNEVKN